MTGTRVVVSLVAACACVGACGSFGATPDPLADAAAPDASTTADGDATAADGAASLDALAPACTGQTVTDGFVMGFPGWDTTAAGDLRASDGVVRSPPTSLFLALPAEATAERYLMRELPVCHVKASIWMYVASGFGDGEVDLLKITDDPSRGAKGVIVVAAKAHPDGLSIEDFSSQRKTSATSDTWVEVKLDVDPAQHRYTAGVGGSVFDGTLPNSFGSGGHLYLLVGASWLEAGRTKTWKVYYDDLTVSVLP